MVNSVSVTWMWSFSGCDFTRDMVRAGNSEAVTMKFTGHTTRAVFDRYNITSMQDMRVAAAWMDAYQENRPEVLPFKKQAAKCLL